MASGSDSGEVDAVNSLTQTFSKVAIDPEHSARRNADSEAANHDDGLLFNPAKYPEETRDELLDKFFQTSAPSKVKRSDGIGWIAVRSPSFEDEGLGDQEGLKTAWKEVLKAKKTISYYDIKELALSYRCLSGNWILFFESPGYKIDNPWEKIARATVLGELGTHAKVTPYKDDQLGHEIHGDDHAISVYTKDFTDLSETKRLERKLRMIGMTCFMAFKPRVYAQLGVSRRNKWGLKACICISKWDNRSRSYKFVNFV